MVQDKSNSFFESEESREKGIRILEYISDLMGDDFAPDDELWHEILNYISGIIDK